MVTLLLARIFYSIACSAFGVCSMAFVHPMLGLHLGCREGIHSQQSTFHGATSFKKTSHTFMVSTQTQSEISNVCLKKKTVPGVLWINITPPFCVYKAPLAPLIVNGIIPHTSCTFIFSTMRVLSSLDWGRLAEGGASCGLNSLQR